LARVGNVGAGSVKDFTAVGDVVNTAARLQGCAEPGQIVLSDSVHSRAHAPPASAARVQLDVKGKAELVDAWVITT
jgi:adenylate cyclase